MMSRRTARTALPPLFALALTAFVVRPIDAPVVHAAPVQVTHAASASAASSTSSTSTATAALLARADRGGSAQTVAVEVPAVVFTEQAVAESGHLRVPVLLTDPTVTARVGIESDASCAVDLRQGVTGWVDCTVTAPTLLVVHLSDGRAFAQAVGVR
jgi:hypothetical protein